MERFGTNKQDVKKNDEIRRQMINDRTITDIFIQDFILEVAEVILIVVGQLSQNDQKFIERISSKYKSKKRIIVIHNFSNLYSVEDVEKKIERDISQAYDTVSRIIPDSEVMEYIEKINDKTKENISHLVLGVEWTESGKKYNEITFKYLKNVLDTTVNKKNFDLFIELKKFLQENFRLYLKFLKRLKNPLYLRNEKDKMYIECDENFEISNPMFNSLGNLVSNPPFEVFEKEDKYIVLVEIPDLTKESNIQFEIKKKLNEFNNLIITGLKLFAKYYEENNNLNLLSFRTAGEFKCIIPLGPNYIRVNTPNNGKIDYKKGVLKVEIEKLPIEEVEQL
jgi:HSP20 family molecular chaperone IbpA